MTVDAPLVCPGCGAGGAPSERFCTRCGSPLVIAGPAGPRIPDPLDPDSARARARKVHPPYAEGELVRVATARHQAEAEMLQGLLLDAGVPSLVRRSGGFDVPDFLAAGPRDVMVPESGLEAARAVLQQSEIAASPDPDEGAYQFTNRPIARLFLGLLAGAGLLGLLVWLVTVLNS